MSCEDSPRRSSLASRIIFLKKRGAKIQDLLTPVARLYCQIEKKNLNVPVKEQANVWITPPDFPEKPGPVVQELLAICFLLLAKSENLGTNNGFKFIIG